jgi:hypothetical protein
MDCPLETHQAQGEEGQLWLEAIHAGMMAIPSGFFCWLVVWNMNFIFPYIGNNHPN